MTRLYLVRHGQTDWNIEGRWQGHVDIPLNALGHQQAASVAKALAGEGLSAIYSSDLSRARQTAEALSAASGQSIRFDPRLREIHQGEWQGLKVSEIRERYGEAFDRRMDNPETFAPPGGETVAQVRDRLAAAVVDICRTHTDQRVAIVSHGFSVGVMRVHFTGLPLQQAWNMIPNNDEWHMIEVDPGPA